MNTSRKGNNYEWAFKKELLYRRGVKAILRTAGSHGLFDVIALTNDIPGGWIDCYQLKSSVSSCTSASKLTLSLWNRLGMPTSYGVNVVHRTSKKEFCEH